MTDTEQSGRSRTRWEFVLAIALVSGIGAAFAPAKPTGIALFDTIERFVFAVIVTLFTACSRRWVWLILAGTATVLAANLGGHLFGGVALAFALHAAFRGRHRDRTTGALIGALSIQPLLHTRSVGFFGLTALIVGFVVALVIVSGFRTMRRRNKRRILVTTAVATSFVVLASAGFALAAKRASDPINSAVSSAQSGLDAAAKGKQNDAANSWLASNRYFRQAKGLLGTPFAKIAYTIPVLSQQAQVVTTAAGSGSTITASAAHAATVAPYQTLRATDGSFDLRAIASMERPVAVTAASMRHARSSIDESTSPWLIRPLHDRVTRFRTQLDDAIPEADGALRAIRVAPELLGGNGTRRYLLLFANPAESRGMGGFIGAWAQLDADNGRLTLVRHGKMGDLNDATDPQGRHITAEPEFLARYGHLQPARYIQNISASPDFPTVARVAEQLYPQAGGTKIDGAMYIDPIALAALLQLTGPVTAEGVPVALTSANAAQFLMHDQYLEATSDDRSDLLSSAAEATFDALTHRPLPSIRGITSVLSPMVHARRLLASVTNSEADRYLTTIGLTGSFPRSAGNDLISVRYANGSANKADYYLHEATFYRASVNPATGRTKGTMLVKFQNTAPASGEPAYVLGNQDTRAGRTDGRPFGSTTLQVSMYSALAPTDLTIDGMSAGIQVQHEFGLWVSTQTVTVPPGGSVTLVLTTEGMLEPGTDYRLTVVPQPGANQPSTIVQAVRSNGTLSARQKSSNLASRTGSRVHVFNLELGN